VKDNIAEGYGRRSYQNDYVKFLIYAQASCDECYNQLLMILELYPELTEFNGLSEEVDSLGKMINKFIQSIESR
jgi:four helix bundle protein